MTTDRLTGKVKIKIARTLLKPEVVVLDSAMSWLGIDKETKQPFDGTPDNVSNLKAKSDVDLTWIRLVGSKPDNVNILDDFTAEEIGKIGIHTKQDFRQKLNLILPLS